MPKPGVHGLGVIAAAAVMAAPLAHAEVVKPGESPGLGLGLTGAEIPDPLKKAKADPYAAPAAPACETIPKEIAALDAVLGPDADAPPEARNTSSAAGHLVASTVRSLIPHRAVVRLLTGAERKEQARSEAAMAGWSRRGYLKGMSVNLGCADRAAGAQVAQAPAPAAAQPPPHIALVEPPAQTVEAPSAPVLLNAMAPPPATRLVR